MTRFLRNAACACLLLVLVACSGTGTRLVPAGDGVRAFDMQMDTSLDWARERAPRQELWTIDGALLNRFVVYSNVKPKEHVLLQARERKSRPDGPWYRPGMRPDEIRDVLLDAMRGSGWSNIQATNLRPVRFGNAEGLRFEATMTIGNGLIYKAMFGAIERNGKLTHFYWAAPREHYYDRDAAAVERMIASIRFVE
ncbi:hypothetical protein [Arenimonas sp.]|uniref:hypothetical protein n=1 Tax=Arenimonas sp. TaxID=1872635 RepID=UPI0039E3648B